MSATGLSDPARRDGGAVGRRTVALVGLAVVALLALCAILVVAEGDGLPAFSAIPDLLRVAAASVLLFGACGYAPALVALPVSMRPHLYLAVLPIGAALSGLGLTVLCTFGVPLPVAIAVLLLAGAGAALLLRARGAAPAADADLRRAGGLRWRLWIPAAIAVAVAVLMSAPQLRPESLATVLGSNGDAHMATGAAELLQVARPGAERLELPIDHMPPVWRSKYPILYVLAGVSTLSGLDPVQTFSTLIAVLAGLAVVGVFLLAYHVAGAPAAAAVLAMGLVAADRIVFHVGLSPFYNQLWGIVALPFALVFGWKFLWEPGRGPFALLLLFAATATFAYPLLVPFPALFILLAGLHVWRRRREEGVPVGWLSGLRLPRGWRSVFFWAPVVLVVLPVGLLLLLEAFGKMEAALRALLPGGNLAPWSGDAIGFDGPAFFLGLPSWAWPLAVAILALAAAGLRSVPHAARLALGAVLGSLFLTALWLQLRGEGALFYFRALVFAAPLTLMLAGLGIWSLLPRVSPARRPVALACVGLLFVALVASTAVRIGQTHPHASREVWELRDWSRGLPPLATIRIDAGPTGVQQWAGYMLADRPLSARDPLRAFFPHPPVGRKADYLLANAGTAPADAEGPPVRENRQFALYRMAADVPGPDVSSRRLVDPQLLDGASAE